MLDGRLMAVLVGRELYRALGPSSGTSTSTGLGQPWLCHAES